MPKPKGFLNKMPTAIQGKEERNDQQSKLCPKKKRRRIFEDDRGEQMFSTK